SARTAAPRFGGRPERDGFRRGNDDYRRDNDKADGASGDFRPEFRGGIGRGRAQQQ
ncbi:hypothetical protein IWW45_006121, partial [Coemansia sp. RSA 485]